MLETPPFFFKRPVNTSLLAVFLTSIAVISRCLYFAADLYRNLIKAMTSNRMFTIKLGVISIMALLISFQAHAQLKEADLEWKLKRDRKGIQVYLARVPDSKFRAIFSTMEVEVPPLELAALVMDIENCSNWASMCKSAEIIERVSASESYVYSINDAPFPVANRDVVANVHWSLDRNTGVVSMRSDAVPNKLSKKKGLVRIQNASSEWHFTPKENGIVLVESYAHIDPNGKIPSWLINLLLVDSPYKTLKRMRKLALTRQYKGVTPIFADQDTK